MFGRVEYAFAYLICIIMGVATLIYPSESVSGVIGLHFTYIYGFMIAAGGIGGLIGVMKPNYRVEMNALFVLTAGMLCYGIALWGIFAERINPHDGLVPAYAPPLIVCAFAIVLFVKARYLYIMNRKLIAAADGKR